MHFISGLLSIIILLGAVQGFILSSLLFFSRKNRQANRLLSFLIFFISLASLKLYGAQQGWFDDSVLRLVDAVIPLIIVMPIGPLIFFYMRSSVNPDFRLTKKDRVHFYPVIIDVVPQLAAIIFIAGVLTNTIKNDPRPWGNFIDTYNVYSDIPRWVSVTLYCWMAARELSVYRKARGPGQRPQSLITGMKMEGIAAGQKADQVGWLRQFIRLFLIFQGIWLIYLVPYVIPKYTDWLLDRVDWYPVYVPLAILVYWLGIKGYVMSQREYFMRRSSGTQLILPAPLIEQAISLLKTAMEKDRLYLNPTLTVALLAEHTGIGQKNISAVLNQHLHKSFSDFVNEYRVNAIRERLLNGESKHLTIAGLAYECGFNSLPTFQRAFKAVMGQTPKEFLSQNA